MKVVGAIFTVLMLSGCGWMYEMGQNSEFDISEADITIPAFTFVNQENEAVGSSDLEGDYWLANFAFTNCTTVCLTMMPNMNQLQNDLESEGHNVQFVTFTADPIADTPEQLNQYAHNIGVENKNWDFLTGYSIEELETFSNEAFRVPYAHGEQPEDIIHSTSFFLMNTEGHVVRKYNGLEMNQEEMLEDIIATISQENM
ncbi:SCO family protein [Alkalihalobacillus sp. LMS6]|uniref:SCO family protein n=1 Tax=Alkalihalobacillus sp. LMS6 TaxID=2924034 RepID=UPI0020D1D0FC|nr:SCO family protein [Alkalihalobacillus sp. LMS6]UTR05045.1 SCO family protein [Alkalihalobacillus sp. LMS6]